LRSVSSIRHYVSPVRAALQRVVVAAGLMLATAALAAAGTVSGVVHNGTSGKTVSGADVILIQLQGGMTPVGMTKTDAQGRYTLSNDAIGQGPMLIRVIYKDVMFHQPLVPGTSTLDVTVYEPTSNPASVTADSRLMVFQPSGDKLAVVEEYALKNTSTPPEAYFNDKGNFDFSIPNGASLSQVSSWGPSGMPVVQGTINRGDRKFAIAYAFQPGNNGVRYSYEVPYPGNQTTLHFTADRAVQRFMLAAAPSVQVTATGFMSGGNQQGFNVYIRENVAQGTSFDVSVAGTAPPPSDQGADGNQQDASAGGAEADQTNGHTEGPTIQTMPDRMDSLKWIVIGGFGLLLAMGTLLLWRKPEMAIAGMPVSAPEPPARTGRMKAKPAPSLAPPSASPVDVPAQTAADVNRKVEQGLDGLKDKLFRLELRRQAGTISEEEYALERATTEKILRELVQG